MIIKIDVESDLFQQIENLVKEGKYQNVMQFIKIALSNQIQEEHSISPELDDNFPVTDYIKEKQELTIKDEDSWRANLEYLPVFEQFKILRKDDDFIWSFYNRFFPIKIAISNLAHIISSEKPWCDLEEWKESATIEAQAWYEKLRMYELHVEIKMHNRKTIGLPTHSSELKLVKKRSEQIRIRKKIDSSKNRFANQFVGRYNKKNNHMEGACFAMNLISVKISGDTCFVSLTELGKKFAVLDNPIFNKDHSKIFSDEEVKLIYADILPQFKTEYQIIQDIIEELHQRSLTADEIQEIFYRYKELIYEYTSHTPEILSDKDRENKIIQTRVATMGRLSELGIVNWEIINSISNYSLNKEKMKLLGI